MKPQTKSVSRAIAKNEKTSAPSKKVESVAGSAFSQARGRAKRAAPGRAPAQEVAVTGLLKQWVAEAVPPAEKIRVIREGVPASVLNDMAIYLQVSKGELFTIVRTPESTAHKLIKEDRVLDAGASERVVRVADIVRMANEALGGRELAARWLKTPNFALSGETPLSMLDTEPGAVAVRQILNAINYGGAV
jgi:putative toxin-antitoxin system antitoxin component (TIGR02293 family)